jgi:hypothetical protein
MIGFIAAALALTASAGSRQPVSEMPVACSSALSIDRHRVLNRAVEPEDLVELFDIGSNAEAERQPLFTISPDRKTIALVVRRALASATDYCTGLFLVDRTGQARLVDSAPGAIRFRYANLLEKADFPTGFARVITPQWSLDGRHLAYLKLIDGQPHIWLMNGDGSDGRAIAGGDLDILEFQFTQSGDIIAKTSDPSVQLVALEAEVRSGIHYDARFSPVASGRPFLRGPLPTRYIVIDVDDLHQRAATPLEIASIRPERQDGGAVIATTERGPDGITRIVAKGTQQVECRHALCRDVFGDPWISGGNRIRYFRREGWGNSQTAVYEWAVGRSAPHRLVATDDYLLDCADQGRDLICVSEGSTQPRRLVRIAIPSGKVSSLFDPNPGFGHLKLGHVRRLHWRNRLGVECFGDLVLPVDYEPDRKYPLMVVQYISRGFLRGGTGDEYPIQAFAGRGYAVLSVQRPAFPASNPAAGFEEREREALVGFEKRKNVLFTIEDQIRDLIAEGLVDPARIGITGLSEGSSTVQYAAVHSNLFAAAAMSTCCWDPSQAWLLGPAIQSSYHSMGWPNVTDNNGSFWAAISLARNARQIRMPILLQVSDDEFRASLESYIALQEVGHPADLYVFPNEHHVKWEPVHRLAIYQRNLDWFGFWLKGEAPTLAPDHEASEKRWRTFERQWKAAKGEIAPP